MAFRPATRAELRELDRRAIEDFGIPSATLMANAARAVADVVRAMPGQDVAVFVGKGNNGGDGRIVATLLDSAKRVRLVDVERDTDFSCAGVVVDAIFGTGLDREVTGRWREAIEAINNSGGPVVAVDIPSGLDCDTGRPLGVAVRATTTVTFGLTKVGFSAPGASDYTGRVIVADIGYPPELLAAFKV